MNSNDKYVIKSMRNPELKWLTIITMSIENRVFILRTDFLGQEMEKGVGGYQNIFNNFGTLVIDHLFQINSGTIWIIVCHHQLLTLR